jgi:hypothetical protein
LKAPRILLLKPELARRFADFLLSNHSWPLSNLQLFYMILSRAQLWRLPRLYVIFEYCSNNCINFLNRKMRHHLFRGFKILMQPMKMSIFDWKRLPTYAELQISLR